MMLRIWQSKTVEYLPHPSPRNRSVHISPVKDLSFCLTPFHQNCFTKLKIFPINIPIFGPMTIFVYICSTLTAGTYLYMAISLLLNVILIIRKHFHGAEILLFLSVYIMYKLLFVRSYMTCLAEIVMEFNSATNSHWLIAIGLSQADISDYQIKFSNIQLIWYLKDM